MSRRLDAKTTSDTSFRIRCTKDEHAEWRALAEYLGKELSTLIREMLRDRRRELVAEGKRPPLRPRE